jgi:two-component system, NarL family, sensor histidine kinase DevS
VPADVAEDIVAVVREALANVARHAGAQTVTVDVSAKDDRVTVSVADNGRGLEPGGRPGGHGLANLRRRAVQRGGTFETSNRPSGGAELRWSVPLRSEE